MSDNITHLPQQRNRQQLLHMAAVLIDEAVGLDEHETFYDEEKRLAEDLIVVGHLVTTRRLTEQVAPEPKMVVIDGVPHSRVTHGAAIVLTPFGWVRIQRWLYRPVGQSTDPTTALLENRCGFIEGATPRMAELLARYEATTTSRDAIQLMDKAGVRAPTRSRQEDKSGRIGAALADKLVPILEQVRSKQQLPPGAVSITIGVDRISVPYEESTEQADLSERTKHLRSKTPYERTPPQPFEVNYHMDFVGCATIRDEHGQALCCYRYAQSHTEPIENLIDALCKDISWAKQANPALKVAVCQDGARELWPPLWRALEKLAEVEREEVYAVVDFPHLWPRVSAVVKTVWGQEAAPGWKLRLLNQSGGMGELENELMLLIGTNVLSDSAHEAIDSLLTYIEERTDSHGAGDKRHQLFDYARQRSVGLPVGSGDIEATAKTLVSVRLKRSGCRWKVPGARACMTLRALAMSDDRWDLAFRVFALNHIRTIDLLEHETELSQPLHQEAA